MTAPALPAALEPGDPAFAAAVAPFVTTTTPRPDLVVEARSPADVVAAVRWAGAEGRPVPVQATGHQLLSDPAGSAAAVRASVCTVLRAVTLAAKDRETRVFCAIRPPGHHASVGAGACGFCLGALLNMAAPPSLLAAEWMDLAL